MITRLRLSMSAGQRIQWEQWAERSRSYWRDPDPARKHQIKETVFLPGRRPKVWLPSGWIVPAPIMGGARLFDDASTQYLESSSPPVTAAPFTMAILGRSNDDTILQGAFDFHNNGGAVNRNCFILMFGGASAGDPIQFRVADGVNSTTFSTTTGYTANVWHHACAVEASATDHRVFIDGGSKGSSTTSRTPTGINRIAIGRISFSTPGVYFSGDLAEAAIWDTNLSDAEVALMGAAYHPSPLLMKPANLIYYCPVTGNYSPEIEIVNSANMTVSGATKTAAPPRITYQPRRKARRFTTAVAAGDALPMAWKQYRQRRVA